MVDLYRWGYWGDTGKSKVKSSNFNVLCSVHPDLDAEAVRVVKSMPKWKPGMQKGEPVRCKYTLPVMFKLQ